MPAADTAKLVASLSLDARAFNKGAASASSSLGKLEGTVGRIGQRAQQGIGSLGKNVALIGVAATGAIALAVRSGLQDLSTLNSAIVSVDAAIASVGQTGQETGAQVAQWANQIEADIGAAFDDKDITAAAATLLRFGKVTPRNLQPALVVMTDLATKTGDIDSAASLLAKALADPTKAAGKLARQGIILTKAQQATIKAMVKHNDIAGAQKVILDELSKTTAGAAAASQDKYARSISVLNDVAEDARKALAEGFLPVISKVSDKLGKAIADPKFLNGIKAFGTELAGGLDDLVSIAERLPWGAIGDSLKIAGAGAKAVLNAFVSLPPWVQTAVLTGWGLNKLTGGALSGIVGELGKGLIKGVLGMNAGVVNINAATVNGGGGIPGAAPAGGGGLAGAIGKGLLTVSVVGIAAVAAETIGTAIVNATGGPTGKNNNIPGTPVNVGPGQEAVSHSLEQIKENTFLIGKLDRTFTTAESTAATRQNVTNERLEAIRGFSETSAAAAANGAASVVAATQQAAADQVHTTERHEAIISQKINEGNAVARQAAQLAAGDSRSEQAAVRAAATQTANASVTAGNKSAAAGNVVATAVKNKDLSVTVNNHLTLSQRISVTNDLNAKNNFKSVYNVAF